MTPIRLFAALITAALCVGIAILSALPYTPGDTHDAIVRLAWRFPAPRVQTCRPLSAEEREALPVHMQMDSTCEGRAVPYRLRVVLDETPVDDAVISGAGVRSDRPMYVFREYRVAPGVRRLEVVFEPDGPPVQSADQAASGAGAGRSLTFSSTLSLAPARIALLTYDESSGRLMLRSE